MKQIEDSGENSQQIDLCDMIKECENEERDRKRKEASIRQIEKYIF